MLKKSLLSLGILSMSINALGSVDKNKLDMTDPTQIYSSVGTRVNSEGKIDLNAGFAMGNKVLKIDTLNGMQGAKFKGVMFKENRGLYISGKVKKDVQGVNLGYIHKFHVLPTLKLVPFGTFGVTNNLNEADPTITAGMYIRGGKKQGFKYGADIINTTLFHDDGDNSNNTTVDAYIGYQYKVHLVQIGADNDNSDEDFIPYISYKYAF
jgi:hypothetical protein